MRKLISIVCLLPSLLGAGSLRDGSKYAEHSKFSWPIGQVLAWTFNEGPGVKGWSREANDGVVSLATYEDARVGKGFGFVPNSANGIASINNVRITGAADRTMSFWLKNTSSSQTQTMIQFGLDGIGARYGVWILAGGEVFFWGSSADQTGTSIIDDGAWHHVAVTYDGTTVLLYVDAVLDIDVNKSLFTSASVLRLVQTGPSPVLKNYDGLLDEVFIFNRVFSLAEIEMLYQKGKAG